jgi:hypothetical protein
MHGPDIPWEHEIRIAVPGSYETSDKSYPVLWALDGAIDLAVATLEKLGESVPEMIVVSVGPPPEGMSEFQFRRDWDFSPLSGKKYIDYVFHGPGAKVFKENMAKLDNQRMAEKKTQIFGGSSIFLTFIVDTVRPALSREYRMSDDNILWGHSGGGQFCVHALLKRPDAFKHYICGSPCLYISDYELFKMEQRYAQTHQDLSASLFMGAGEGEAVEGQFIPAWGIVSSTARMAEVLHLRQHPSLKLDVRIFPRETHGSVMLLVLAAGLQTVLKSQYANPR